MMSNMHGKILRACLQSFILGLTLVGAASADNADTQVLAVVGSEVITLSDYHIMMRNESRKRFYHGKPAESQLEAFRREIADLLVDQALLIHEARRRGISADSQEVDRQMAVYTGRAREKKVEVDENMPLWKALRDRLARENIITQLKSTISVDKNPPSRVLQEYYSQNPGMFTEPERLKVSLILLKVPPSATVESWQAARDEATALVKKIRGGENFAELARLHSADASAKNGGDMGYLHSGMLSEEVQKKLHDLRLGETAEPITVLEGIVIVRLEERKPGRLNKYDDVTDKVKKLWYRDAGQKSWESLLARLRKQTSIKKSRYYPGGSSNNARYDDPISDYRDESSYRLRSSRLLRGTRLSGYNYDKTEIARHVSCCQDITGYVAYTINS